MCIASHELHGSLHSWHFEDMRGRLRYGSDSGRANERRGLHVSLVAFAGEPSLGKKVAPLRAVLEREMPSGSWFPWLKINAKRGSAC